MEERKTVKISLSTFFLILAIIVIVIMVYFIYKFYNEKRMATEQVTDLNNQVSNLESTIDKLKGEIDSMSNTINKDSSNSSINNTINSNDIINDTIVLKIGEYVIKEINVTPDPESYGIASVEIKENNEFKVDMPLGTSYTGTYNIEGNNLICKATKRNESEGGGSSSNNTNITFTFLIVNNTKIKFLSATESGFELTVGMTYILN